MEFALHPEAIEDLDGIHQYIGQFNPTAADRILDDLFSAFGSIAEVPGLGFQRLDLTSRPLRFTVIHDYLAAYAPLLEPILIVAVVDGRRSPRVMAAILRGREQSG